jgi:hypothetical protein
VRPSDGRGELEEAKMPGVGRERGKVLWRISEAGEQAMRVLRPPGHMPTPEEERRLGKLLEAHMLASREMDVEAYRETMVALLEAACSSYRRHIEDPASSPEVPGAQPASPR